MGVREIEPSRAPVATPKCVAITLACQRQKVAEPAGKPGSVVDSHSSRPYITVGLQQPTRRRRGPRHRLPIWSCSRWGLPYRLVAQLVVRSYRTVSPLPVPRTPKNAGPSAVCSLLHFPSAHAAQALPGIAPCGARTFLDMHIGTSRLSGRLRRGHFRTLRPRSTAAVQGFAWGAGQFGG